MRGSSLSPRLDGPVGRYAESHRHPVNRAIHHAGIPALAVAVLGLLSKVAPAHRGRTPALRPSAAWAALLAAGAWYLWHDRRAGPRVTAGLVGAYAVGSLLPARVLAALGGAGVAAHAVGHYWFEGKPPSALSDPAAVLAAPVWLLAEWTGPDDAADPPR